MSHSPHDNFVYSNGTRSPLAISFAPVASAHEFGGHPTTHEPRQLSANNSPQIYPHQYPTTSHYQNLSQASSVESLVAVLSASSAGASDHSSSLNSTANSPTASHFPQPAAPLFSYANIQGSLGPSAFTSDFVGSAEAATPSERLGLGAFPPPAPHAHSPSRHGHSASAPTFDLHSSNFNSHLLHSNPTHFVGGHAVPSPTTPAWEVPRSAVHGHSLSFDSLPHQPQPNFSRPFGYTHSVSHIYPNAPQAAQFSQLFGHGHDRHPSTDSNFTATSSSAPRSIASPASSTISNSPTNGFLPRQSSTGTLRWLASSPQAEHYPAHAPECASPTPREALQAELASQRRNFAGAGGTFSGRVATHSALAPMLTAHKPQREAGGTLSPRSQLSNKFDGMALSSPSTTQLAPSPMPLSPGEDASPRSPLSAASLHSTFSHGIWSTTAAGASTDSILAAQSPTSPDEPNALGLTGMFSGAVGGNDTSAQGGTVGSSGGWGFHASWPERQQLTTDPKRISPITGRPTKLTSPRGWPPKDIARRIYHCPVAGCNKIFGRPSAKETHMRSHSGLKPFVCPIPDCVRPFSVFSNLKRHMVVHPAVDFRGIAVHDLPNLVWVPYPRDGLPGGLRWASNGQLVGPGLREGVEVTTKVSVQRRGLKPRARARKGRKRVKREESEDPFEAEADEGGWGPGASDGDGEEGGESDDEYAVEGQ